MMTDPIADFLTQIKNSYLASKRIVTIPHSRKKENLANLLLKEGYLTKIEKKTISEAKKILILELVYENKTPKVKDIKIVSKPGKRVYIKKGKIPKVLGGLGSVIISTPKGILLGREAKKLNLGGEFICKIW